MANTSRFFLADRTGRPIAGCDTWTRPKKVYQWQPGRSAMELARSWFRSESLSCPRELTDLLQSHPLVADCEFLAGQPEFVTPLPERGEGRNHDLWLRAVNPRGAITICVEAKADEPFGDSIGETIDNAKRRSPRTRMPARAKALLELLFNRPCEPEETPWRNLRYQLVTAFAGTAIQTSRDRSATGVLVVQEFKGTHLDAARQKQNDADFEAFLALLDPRVHLSAGILGGPIPVQSSPHLPGDVNLFVGKITCEVTELRPLAPKGVRFP